ncbi:hypothetical protein MTO96_035355 [Rhipicephalus appendiculatus]
MATGKTPDTYASALISQHAPSDAPIDLSGPGASTDAHDKHGKASFSNTPSTDSDKDADRKTVLTLRQRKQQALEPKRANAAVQDASKTNAYSQPKKKKTYKLPPLPKDDFKIIIRPHQGLPLRNIVSPALAAAIIAACDHQITGEQFLLRIKPGSNIVILSTPHQEVAAKARGIQHLTINGHKHAVNVYAAAGEEALRGVVHGIPPHTPAETLVANMRVRTHGVELIQARMIGDTTSATLTFSGPILPKVVYYYGRELVCHPFRATVQVCKLCRVRGHRTDVCPHPDRQICRMCGLENPSPEHPCELNCASCGGAICDWGPELYQAAKKV